MHQLLRDRRGRGGFTLIEVLVAAVLLMVAIVSVMIMFPIGYSNVDAGGEQTEAATLAQDMLEKVRDVKWDDVDNFGGTSFTSCTPPAGFASCSVGTSSTTSASFSTGSSLVDALLTEWKNAVEARIRNGVGSVQIRILTPSSIPNSKIADVIVSVQFSQGIRGTKAVTAGTRIAE
jgi:Tfp pilus assembly protein PilV